MFQSARERKKSQMPTVQGFIFKCLILTILLIVGGAQGRVPQCCVDGSSWIRDANNCTDGSRVQLGCPHYYVFHPKMERDETVHIIENGNNSTLEFSDVRMQTSYNISQDSFCIAKPEDIEPGEWMALVCFQEPVEARLVWREIFFGLFSMISSLFLAITLLVYTVLPEMRDIQDKATMSVTASFMVAFFFNGNQQLSFSFLHNDAVCLAVAFIMYYAYLCAFFWLNVISFNIWRSVWFPRLKARNDVLFAVYCVIGWGLPLCFLAASLAAHHLESYLRPGFGDTNCWFNGYYATWTYFYGPIMVLLSINLVYLALTSWKLWHVYKEVDCCKMKVLRFKCMMYVKLAVMMGFTWIFEIISYAFGETNQFYWILPDILNVLQGLFIFILFVVSRKRVRKLLAKRRPFNIPFPKSWAAYADQENCGEAVGPEELELSQSS